jgi:hypothetical protein
MVFDIFAAQAAQLGGVLVQSKELRLGSAPVDLGRSEEVEHVLLSLRAAAKDHARRGEDLLTLIERLDAMLKASVSGRPMNGKTDAGLYVLRAVAIAELLQQESAQRFAGHAPLNRLAEATATQLAQGFLARFGGNLATDVQRVFPRFARRLRQNWRPVQKKRRLLPWLINRA